MSKQVWKDLIIGIGASIIGSFAWAMLQSVNGQSLTGVAYNSILRFMINNTVPMIFMCIAVMAYLRARKSQPTDHRIIKELIAQQVKKEPSNTQFEREILEFVVRQRGYMLYNSNVVNFGDGRPRPGIKECYAEELKLLQAKYGEGKLPEIKAVLKILNVPLSNWTL